MRERDSMRETESEREKVASITTCLNRYDAISIMNCSFKNAVFSEKFNLARIIPIFKPEASKGTFSECGVTVTNIISSLIKS